MNRPSWLQQKLIEPEHIEKKIAEIRSKKRRGCLQCINSSDSKVIFDEISLVGESTYSEGDIGDEASSERSRKGPEDDGFRLCRHPLTLATLNGSFDLLHAGHLFILHQARRQADKLLVALNSDASIRQYKSSDRPIIPLQYRLELIAALECVDYVTWFNEPDPRALLARIKPDVHVNGAEYGENCLEAATVRENGGRLHLVHRIPSLSTSAIIERIKLVCV
jgi:rfaE bifunctional protein nucleotidyltransferase chain/domain